MKIQGPQFQRNYIIARYRKSDLHGTSFQSPKINCMLITRLICNYSESLQHPTITILLIKIAIFFWPLSSVYLFQSISTLSSDRIRGPTCFQKALNLIFHKLSSQNMRCFNHATILSPSFHGLRKEHLEQWPAFCVLNSIKNSGGYFQKNWGGVRHASWNPYPISDQNHWFSLPYFIPDQKFDTLFQTWSPGAWHVTGEREKLLWHVHGSWRKHKKGNGLITKWWRSSQFF